MLRVEGVELRFGGVRALKDVAFDIQQGVITALIVPTGAGKPMKYVSS